MQFVKAGGSKNKVELVEAWGKQSKYTLKANWVDHSGARNVVSAKLWGEVVHSRCKNDRLDPLVNGGGMDGYPVLLYHNGEFQGLYTLNTPKDNWTFGMEDKNAREGMLFGSTWSNSVMLQSLISDVNNPGGSGWEVEYCSTEDDPEVGVGWLSEGMNALISFILNNDGEAFRAGIGSYTDVDRCVDYMLYILFIGAADNTGKNIVWATYDGVKYIPSAYDLDGTWGMRWDGAFPSGYPGWGSVGSLRGNLLFARLIDNYYNEIVSRYTELRGDVLSRRNIENKFSSFIGRVPAYVYAAEAQKWPSEPGMETNNLSQLLGYSENRIGSLDAAFDVEPIEKTESAWRVTFACENGAQVCVYPAQDYSAAPVRAAAAYSVNGDGELTKSDGQVNFRVDVPEGCTATVEAYPASAYKNLKTPADTGAQNVWRVTKIKNDLTVRVRISEDVPAPEGYHVSFVCDDGVDVWVYPGSDYTAEPVKTNETVSVESATGVPTKNDGQVNFRLAAENPYDTFEISVAPEKYKNLKGPDETGQENTWRITKIKGDLTVTVRRIPHVHTPGEARTENTVAATCEGRGSYDTVTYCTVCGDEVSRDTVYTDPTGHAWGEWTVVREATVEEEGLRQRVCANDPGHVETDPIQKLTPPEDNSGSGKSLWQTIMAFFQRIADFFRRLFRFGG